MGYRSDIRIATTTRGLEEIYKYCDTHPVEYPFIGADKNDKNAAMRRPDIVYTDGQRSDVAVIGWDFVKWYDEFSNENDNITPALEHLDELEIPWHFMRDGEDMDDREELYGITKNGQQNIPNPHLEFGIHLRYNYKEGDYYRHTLSIV